MKTKCDFYLFLTREIDFSTREKTEKKVKTGRERKKLGVKKVKKAAKSGREKPKVPVKKSEKWPKTAFTPTFFFTPKKKNTVDG